MNSSCIEEKEFLEEEEDKLRDECGVAGIFLNPKTEKKEDAEKINEAKKNGHRIISVGTTSCRVLESVADEKQQINASQGIILTNLEGLRLFSSLQS